MPMARQSQADRLARLQKIMAILLAQQDFTLRGVRQILPEESPRLVARMVRDLTSEGHLREVDDETFCWASDAQDFPARAWLE